MVAKGWAAGSDELWRRQQMPHIYINMGECVEELASKKIVLNLMWRCFCAQWEKESGAHTHTCHGCNNSYIYYTNTFKCLHQFFSGPVGFHRKRTHNSFVRFFSYASLALLLLLQLVVVVRRVLYIISERNHWMTVCRVHSCNHIWFCNSHET